MTGEVVAHLLGSRLIIMSFVFQGYGHNIRVTRKHRSLKIDTKLRLKIL